MRIGIVLALTFGLLSGAEAMAQGVNDLLADEMSSIEWRDCAGHFFYVSSNVAAEVGQNPSPENKKFIDQLNSFATMSIYAGEYKAAEEAGSGKKAPLGRSLQNAQNGKLEFDVRSSVTTHGAMATSEGRNAYVNRYAQKCGGPVSAFTNRFMAATKKP